MDGRAGQSTSDPDPQVVLRQLIRQAQAGSSLSTHQPEEFMSTNDVDDDDEGDGNQTDRSDTSSDGSAAKHSSDDGSSSPPPLAPRDQDSRLLPYHQISASLASITADRRELTTLLQQKKHISTAQKRNGRHQRSLERSLQLLSKVREELKAVLTSLDTADIVDAEDQSLEVIRIRKHAEDAAAASPFRASMVQQIPLLRLQSIERAEYDYALGSRMWLEAEDVQLRTAVKAAVMKAHTIALSMDPAFKGDALAEAAKMDEATAMRLAEQMDADRNQPSSSSVQGRNATSGLDWPTISARVPTRSIEETKTRWYGHLRPSVNTSAWNQEEVEDLIRIATPFLAGYLAWPASERVEDATQASTVRQLETAQSASASRAPVPWQSVAEQLGTGRTAHACFVAYCSAIVQRDQPDMTSAEDENGRELFSLFRGSWRIMALHAMSGPNVSISSLVAKSSSAPSKGEAHDDRPPSILGKVGRDAQTLYRRFRNTTDPALATGSWSLEEDLSLAKAVHDLGSDNWAGVAARIMAGRNSSQCRERWNRRLKQVVAEAGAAATDERGQLNEQVIADIIENKKVIRWNKSMDDLLLPCVDDDFKAKDGKTFADVARYLTDKIGTPLSDKNVRDRISILRRNRLGPGQAGSGKGGKGKRKEPDPELDMNGRVAGQQGQSLAVHHGAQKSPTWPGSNPASGPDQQSLSSEGTPKPPARSRTAIVPGGKRQKL
ncbi:hypothetical protein EX895_006440 [Sporisorium graminicola]|uniref:Myb-like domain-containing protein n=1 Tax=Sporisorium graminicola TaxID=280036 RepID=A0A4U7KNB9_9BASI|nr:hypothetical protein EX895_006440 [Sporisorium graminicola]TKY84538.1 hypothetical protein EX895_006440 [Sporisorium graminicola]